MLSRAEAEQIQELHEQYEQLAKPKLTLFQYIEQHADDVLTQRFLNKEGDVSSTIVKRVVQSATNTIVIKIPIRPNYTTICKFINPNIRARQYLRNFFVGRRETIRRWNFLPEEAKKEFLELYTTTTKEQTLEERLAIIEPPAEGALVKHLKANPYTRDLAELEIEWDEVRASYQEELEIYEVAKATFDKDNKGKRPKRPRKPKRLNAIQREVKTLRKREKDWRPPDSIKRPLQSFLQIHDQLQMLAAWPGAKTGRKSTRTYTYDPMRLRYPDENTETRDWYSFFRCLMEPENLPYVEAMGESLGHVSDAYSYVLSAVAAEFRADLKKYKDYCVARKKGTPTRKIGPPGFKYDTQSISIQSVSVHAGGKADLTEKLSEDGKHWVVTSAFDYRPYLVIGGVKSALEDYGGSDGIRIPRSQYRRIRKALAHGGKIAGVVITRESEELRRRKGTPVERTKGRRRVGGKSRRRKPEERGAKTRYFASIIITNQPVPLTAPDWTPERVVGIDPGVRKFLTLSDGTMVEDLGVQLAELTEQRRRAQQKLSRWTGAKHRETKRGWGYVQAQKRLTKLSNKIARLRKHAHEQIIDRLLAMPYDYYVLEATGIANLTRSAKGTADLPGRNVRASSTLTRRLLEQAISRFRTRLIQRAARVGKVVVLVPAPNTSKRCNACGELNDAGSSEIYTCDSCGHVEDRDLNASQNIRNDGIELLERHGAPPVGGEWSARIAERGQLPASRAN